MEIMTMRPYFILIILPLTMLMSCGRNQKQLRPSHLPVKTAPVTQAVFYHTYTGYGTIQSNRSISLIARFDGVIHLNVKRNSFYRKGELIYALSGPDVVHRETDLRASLASAREQFQFMKSRLRRRQLLKKQAFLSKEAWQELQRNFSLAQQVLRRAKNDWNFFKTMTNFRAPYDGILAGFSVPQGDDVNAGTRLAQFLAVPQWKLVIDYYGDPARLAASKKLTVLLNDSLRAAGQVSFLAKAVSPKSGGREIWIRLNSLKTGFVPGMFVKYKLLFDACSGPAVPEKAIVRKGERYFVVVDENGTYKNEQVKTGRKNASLRELVQGPPLGTRVVTESAFEYFYKNLEKTMKVQD